MPSVVFVHLSDIHFGQEKGESVHIHDDVKLQLLADARSVVGGLPQGRAHGILVTGDIAHSGKKEQYDVAGAWLDKLAVAVGCDKFQIQIIPGNHDVDRSKVSAGAQHLLDDIRAGGSETYEKILANDQDRSSLFARFADYARFCEAYDCPLDATGTYSTNLRADLGSGRSIRFVRMNSSILCTGDESDKVPELIVGARQTTIPRTEGEEVVVLIHHPLHWLKDARQVETYFKSRARVVISGHEHNPAASVQSVEPGADILMLAAGATVPFKSDEQFTYCYNILEFGWDEASDALAVKVHARAWNPDMTRFEADVTRLGGPSPTFVLGCPNFKKTKPISAVSSSTEPAIITSVPAVDLVNSSNKGDGQMPPDVDGYRNLLLRFFRDLREGERLRILMELDAIEPDEDQLMTQSVERKLFDWVIEQGRIADIELLVERATKNKDGGNASE